MSKALTFLFIIIISIPSVIPVYAQFGEFKDACMAKDASNSGGRSLGVDYTIDPPSPIPEGASEANITFTNLPDNRYFLRFPNQNSNEGTATGGRVTLTVNNTADNLRKGEHTATLMYWDASKNDWGQYCGWVTYKVGLEFKPEDCRITLSPPNPKIGQSIIATISNSPQIAVGLWVFYNRVLLKDSRGNAIIVGIGPDGTGRFTIPASSTPQKDAAIELKSVDNTGSTFCKTTFDIQSTVTPITTPVCTISPAQPTIFTDKISIIATNLPLNTNFRADLEKGGLTVHIQDPGTTNATIKNSGSAGIVEFPLMGKPQANSTYTTYIYYNDPDPATGTIKRLECTPLSFNTGSGPPSPPTKKCGIDIECSKAGGEPCSSDPKDLNPGFKTAIGCIHTNPVALVKDVLKFVIAISGGLSFLMMLLGAFQMLTSAGNPDALNAGRERLTSAIIGLLFVIFSILLLQVIGVDILKLPGFGR